MRDQIVVGGRLRPRLLAGVAAVALAVPATHWALAQQVDKFQPHAEAGGLVTNDHGGGDVDFFLPLWQDPGSLLFGDLRGTFTSETAQGGSFGLGYRTQVDPEWILGGYGFLDVKHTDKDNTFYQGSVGLEALSVDWDFRVNGYVPFNSAGGDKKEQGTGGIGGTGLTIIGTDIGYHTRSEQEKALFGVDGEVGWRLPIFPADGDVDLRAYAGGFYFGASDADSLAGPRGRLEVRLYDLDLLGVQSRLTAQGLVQWDDKRGTIGGGGLELRIPLGGLTGSPATKLSALDRRMVDRVVRDPDVIETRTARTDSTRIQKVQVDGLVNTPTHKIVFADGTGSPGDPGTQSDPTDLNAAPGKFPGKNEIIVAQGDNGPLSVTNPVQLESGQTLLGGGTPVGVTLVGGPDSGRHIIFTPPGTRPTVVGDTAGLDLIELASGGQNRVTGLDLAGSFANGISGVNLYRAIITDDVISGGAADGIFLQQSGPGAQPSSYLYVARNRMAGNASDGILIDNQLSDGLSHAQLATIIGNLAASNGGEGIDLSNVVSGAGTALTQYLFVVGNAARDNASDGFHLVNLAAAGGTIRQGFTRYLGQPAVFAYNTAVSNGDEGFSLVNIASEPGATIEQALLVRGDVASSNGGEGILLVNAASDGATVSQTTHIYFNTAVGNAVDGIAVVNDASGAGAAVTQGAVLRANTASGNGGGVGPLYQDGIVIVNYGSSGGSILQSVAVEDNLLGANGAHGLGIGNFVRYGASVDQTADVSGNLVSANGSQGIYVINRAGTTSAPGVGGGTIAQVLTGTSNIAVGNLSDGVRLRNIGYFSGSVVSQSATLADSTITGNGSNGVAIVNDATSGALISQAVTIDPSIITSNAGSGIYGRNTITSAALSQTVAILDDIISENSADGVRLVTESSGPDATVARDITVAGNIIAHNGSNGVLVRDVLSSGSVLRQTVSVGANTVTYNASYGIRISAAGIVGTGVTQSVAVTGNTVGHEYGDGIHVRARLYSGLGSAVLTQHVSITGNMVTDISGPGGDGIQVSAHATDALGVDQIVTVSGNRLGTIGDYGITIDGHFTSIVNPSTAFVSVTGNVLSGIGADGISMRTVLSSAALVQSVAFDANSLADIGGDGIAIRNRVYSSGTLTQSGTIDDNTITLASGNGILLHNDVTGGNATLTQLLTLDPNTITGNGLSGIYGRNHLESATVSQSLGILDNVIAGNGSDGIRLLTTSAVASTFSQGLSIGGNTITDNASNGVFVSSGLRSGSTLSQTARLTQNTIAGGAGYGIVVIGRVRTTGVILVQSVAVTDNTVSDFGSTGILARARFYGPGVLTQAVSIGGNSLSGIGGDGISASAFETSGTEFSQSVAVTGNQLLSVTGTAIAVRSSDYGGEEFGQAVSVTGNMATSVGGEGIMVETDARNLASAGTAAITVDANSIAEAGSNGIRVRARMTSATLVETTFGIDQNTITGVGAIGIYLKNALDAAAVLTQGVAVSGASATIDDNFVSDASGPGILVDNEVGGAGATLSQVLTIDPNTVMHARYAGIAVLTGAYSGGLAVQSIAVDGNLVSDVQPVTSAAVGIAVRNLAGKGPSSGNISQALSITGNDVTDIGTSAATLYGIGIAVSNRVRSNSTISQTATVATNTVSGVYGASSALAVGNVNSALQTGGTITQALAIDDNILSAVHGQGTAAGIGAYNTLSRGATVTQTLTIDPNTIAGIGGSSATLAVGIVMQNDVGDSATLSLSAGLLSNSIAGMSAAGLAAGIMLYAGIGALASASQAITIGGNHVSGISTAATAGNASAVGIQVQTYLDGENGSTATVVQTLLLSGNGVSGVQGPNESAAGIAIDTVAHFGSDAQTVVVTGNSVASVSGDGIVLRNDARRSGVISQTLTLGSSGGGNVVSGVGRDGIALYDVAANRGTIGQSFSIVANSVTNTAASGSYGIALKAFGESSGSVTQSGTVLGNSISGMGGAGLWIYGSAGTSKNTVFQSMSVGSNVIDGNGGDGVDLRLSVSDGASNHGSQNVFFAGNAISSNDGDGLHIGAYGGSALQTVILSPSGPANTITGNSSDGVFVKVSEGSAAVHLYSTLPPSSGPNIVSPNGSQSYQTLTQSGGILTFSK